MTIVTLADRPHMILSFGLRTLRTWDLRHGDLRSEAMGGSGAAACRADSLVSGTSTP